MTLKPTLILLPLSWLYGLVVMIRNVLYDRKILKTSGAGVPVVSVGNISTGGTGKTPLVEAVVAFLQREGVRPAVLSRGYGRKSRGYQVVSNGHQRCAEAYTAGDEPAQLAEKLERTPVVVDEDRLRGARTLVRDFRPQMIVLDDGFQHRRLTRDLDIVLVTAEEVLQGSWMLPAGRRREPWSSLQRAGLVAVSKCRSIEEFERVRAALTRRVRVPVIGVRTVVRRVRIAGGKTGAEVENRRVMAVSGIADPGSFEQTLAGLDCIVAGHRIYRDHYWYSNEDLTAISGALRATGADLVVTTEKDEVRLMALPAFDEFVRATSCAVVEIGAEVFAGQEAFASALRSLKKPGENT